MCKQFGINIVKSVAITSNVMLLLVALILCVRSASTYEMMKSFQNVLDPITQNLPLVGLITSILIIVTVLFGFVGMFLNAFGMLCLYVSLLMGLAVSCLLSGSMVMSEVAEMQKDMMYFLNKLDQGYNITHNVRAMQSIDAMQYSLQCCGFSAGKHQYASENTTIPKSCCKDPLIVQCFGDDVWPQTCLEKLQEYGIVALTEQGCLLLCITACLVMQAGIGYVLAMAVRQYYYY